MAEPTIKRPVGEVPPITRDVEIRWSKYDPVLERAVMAMKNKKARAVPVEFESHSSATWGARRIRDRVDKHAEVGTYPGLTFTVEQRGDTVYVTASSADE